MPERTTKPSTADYPVEPAERVSQQERLRKAAAAGASALKSPIHSVLSRPPQNSSVPLATLAQSSSSTDIAAGSSQALPAETPLRGVSVLQMNEEILVELRKISTWADMQRKVTKWMFIVLAIFIPAMVGIGILMERRVKDNLEDTASRQNPEWYDVEHNVRLGDCEKAIRIGEELILRTPQDPEAHQRLAAAYLASGNIEKAREHYAEAFRLFPSEENEKLLTAIDKRSKSDKP